MRYSDFKIFRFDFVSLYCLIYKIAQDMTMEYAEMDAFIEQIVSEKD